MQDSRQERDTRPLGELFSQLAGDTTLLLRQEIALAKKEFQGALTQAVGGAIALAIGGVLATVGLVAILTSVILALALVMPHWAAALVVGILFVVLAAVFVFLGINRLRKLKLIPERTARTLKDDAAMIREKAEMSDAKEEKSLTELEADIARTRAQLGRDVDEISYKLSPDRFKAQAQGTLQDAQEAVMDTVNEMTDTVVGKTKEAGSSFVDMVRRHPLPTALIGAGVALLAVGGGVGASRARDDDEYVGYGGRYGYGEGDYGGYVRPGYSGESSVSTGHLGETSRGSGASRSFESYGAYDSGYDTGSYTPTAGYGSRSGNDQSFGDRASEVGERAKYGAQDAGRGVAGFLEEQPLIAGLITVVLGALIGLALPGTRQEDQLMGEARDNLAEQAKGVAERAREVAQKTFDEAKETAKQEFSKVQEDVKVEGKNLLEKGKEAAKNVVQEAKEAGKNVAQATKETAKNEADKQKPS